MSSFCRGPAGEGVRFETLAANKKLIAGTLDKGFFFKRGHHWVKVFISAADCSSAKKNITNYIRLAFFDPLELGFKVVI